MAAADVIAQYTRPSRCERSTSQVRPLEVITGGQGHERHGDLRGPDEVRGADVGGEHLCAILLMIMMAAPVVAAVR